MALLSFSSVRGPNEFCSVLTFVFAAVDSFLDVHFHVIVTEVTDHALRAIYGEPFEPIRMDTMGYVLVGMWLVLSLCGFLSQSRTGGKSVAQVAQGKEVIVIMKDRKSVV